MEMIEIQNQLRHLEKEEMCTLLGLPNFLLLRLLNPFILKPQEVGRSLGQTSAWKKSWEDRKDMRGLLTHAQGPEVLCHQGYMVIPICMQ